MKRILILMDDINYRGGAHFATFKIANFLSRQGNEIHIYSPNAANKETLNYLDTNVILDLKKSFSNMEYVIVPFENSCFREEVSRLKEIVKIQWIHIDYARWREVVTVNVAEQEKVFERFNHLIFVSEHNCDSFKSVFPQLEKKCRVIYNFLDIEQIREQAKGQIDSELFKKKCPEQLNIVISGRLEPQKAYHRLIDAVKVLNDRKLNIEYYILGVGYEYSELKERCQKYNIKNIHFLGYRANPFPYIRAADVFAILSEYEGLALVIAESLAVGTPVISTESGGVHELLKTEQGWIIKNDIYSIINGLDMLYKNRGELERKRFNLEQYEYNNLQIKKNLVQLIDGNKAEVKEEKKMKIEINGNIQTNIDVSIIVPVYNMEKYLKECLDSLVKQTLNNYEIIVINDGSTDSSPEIIDDYVYRYADKIRAFTIDNSGLGEARNYGISKAKGRYLGFVDSDDWVTYDMFEKMYQTAIKDQADCVMSDYIAFWDTGKKEYVASISEKNADRFDILKYSAKYGVVNICTKLIDRSLFDRIRFPKGFYEDLATTPIILSYAKKISYVREGLYFYRQRSGSITSIKSNDQRVFDCCKAWDRIFEFSNPVYEKEIRFAIYWSINFFCTNFLDEFTAYSKQYYDKHRDRFENNEYIENAVNSKQFLDFNRLPQIPKIIHYCWFGHNEKSDLVKMCIASWKRYAPDYELKEWNESNCDINENVYVKKAYEEKKWAFVSDYFRLKALKEFGGIYMDTDMELMKALDPYLCNHCFFAFETPIFVHAGIIGAEKEASIISDILNTYATDIFSDSCEGIPNTIPRRITEILEKQTNLIKNGKTQLLNNGTKVYSANIMTMNFHDGKCVANHHYEGNWVKEKNSTANYGYEVMKHYFTWNLTHSDSQSGSTSCCYTNETNYMELYEQMINSTSWKITKPLRIIMDRLRKK